MQKVYGWEQADVLPEEERSEGMCKAYEFAQAQRKERAQSYLVPQPKVHKRFKQLNTLDGWMQNVSAHSDAAARAAVRDGDPSVEVLVMQRRADGSIHFLPWQENGRAVASDQPPQPEDALQVARQKLRLPVRQSVEGGRGHPGTGSGQPQRPCGVAAVSAAARRAGVAAGRKPDRPSCGHGALL